MQQLDDALVKAIAQLEALRGAGDIANLRVDAGGRWPQIDDGRGAEAVEAHAVRAALPLLVGKARILFGLLRDELMDALDDALMNRPMREW